MITAGCSLRRTCFRATCSVFSQNRHFFLAHYFRDNYDRFASKLPFVSSGIKITRIEVWITNKNSNFEQARGLADVGEAH